MVYVLGRNTRLAIGTSSFLIIFTAIFGVANYIYADVALDWGLVALTVPFVFAGAYTGSRWGLKHLKTRSVALIFILVLFLAAGKMTVDLVT